MTADHINGRDNLNGVNDNNYHISFDKSNSKAVIDALRGLQVKIRTLEKERTSARIALKSTQEELTSFKERQNAARLAYERLLKEKGVIDKANTNLKKALQDKELYAVNCDTKIAEMEKLLLQVEQSQLNLSERDIFNNMKHELEWERRKNQEVTKKIRAMDDFLLGVIAINEELVNKMAPSLKKKKKISTSSSSFAPNQGSYSASRAVIRKKNSANLKQERDKQNAVFLEAFNSCLEGTQYATGSKPNKHHLTLNNHKKLSHHHNSHTKGPFIPSGHTHTYNLLASVSQAVKHCKTKEPRQVLDTLYELLLRESESNPQPSHYHQKSKCNTTGLKENNLDKNKNENLLMHGHLPPAVKDRDTSETLIYKNGNNSPCRGRTPNKSVSDADIRTGILEAPNFGHFSDFNATGSSTSTDVTRNMHNIDPLASDIRISSSGGPSSSGTTRSRNNSSRKVTSNLTADLSDRHRLKEEFEEILMGSPSRRNQKTQEEIDASLDAADLDLEGVIDNLKAEIKEYEGEYNTMLALLREKHKGAVNVEGRIDDIVDSTHMNTEELKRLLHIKQYKQEQLARLNRALLKVNRTKSPRLNVGVNNNYPQFPTARMQALNSVKELQNMGSK